MVIEAILGTLTGGLTSIIPGVISWMKRKDELNHAQAMAKINLQLATQQANIEMDVIDARADANEGESLRRHDSDLDGDGFIDALRRSVRPIITYLFFFLFVFVKVVALISAINVTDAETILWSDLMSIVWDSQTSAIFGAIMGFWFGGRAIEKLMK